MSKQKSELAENDEEYLENLFDEGSLLKAIRNYLQRAHETELSEEKAVF